MLLDYEVNGAWVLTKYTRADNNIKSIYLCNITDANTPGSSYPTDIISLYNNKIKLTMFLLINKFNCIIFKKTLTK